MVNRNFNLPNNFEDLTDEQKKKLGDILDFLREFKLIAVRIEDFAMMIATLLAVHDSLSKFNNMANGVDITDHVDSLDEVTKKMIDILHIHCPDIEIKMIRKDLKNDT